MDKKRADGLLFVALESVSAEQLGVLLLGDVYQDLSAYVIWNEDGGGIVKLFDTFDSTGVLNCRWPKGQRLLLYSNHPQTGLMAANKYDVRNLGRMPEETEFYVVCENKCVKVGTP